MSRNRYGMLVVLLCAAAMFVFQGCGGGGDDGVQTDLQAQVDMLMADLEAANEATMEAEADLATARTDLATARQALMTAQNRVTELETLAGDATNPAATSLRGQLAAARADLATAQAQLTAAQQQVTQLQSQLSSAQQQAQQQEEQFEEQLSEAEQAEINARAGTYIEAINDGGEERTGVTVAYQRGSTLQINPDGNFSPGSGAPSISGFTPRTYSRQVGVSGKQTVYLYTNIQAPSTRAFWKIHGLEVTDATAAGESDHNPTPTAAAQYITDPADSTMATGVRVSGRFDGVSGIFTCTINDCKGSKTGIDLAALVPLAAGVRSFAATGEWTFKPSSITSGVQQLEDPEHLYFGIWVEEPNVASMTHDYEYITGGSEAFEDVDREGLPGTAEFRGGAVGKYVTRNQVGENAKIGTFTAAANFTAVFGDAPTLEGRITDFQDGSQTLSGWSVHLGGATSGTPSEPTNEPATFTNGAVIDGFASALIGGVSAEGKWDATLYGNANDALGHNPAADPNPRDLVNYPLARYPVADLAGLVGNFYATSGANAALAGAFGATPQ